MPEDRGKASPAFTVAPQLLTQTDGSIFPELSISFCPKCFCLGSLKEFRIIPVSVLEIATSHFSSCAAQPKDSADIKYKTHPTGILVMYILSMAAKF